MKKKGLKIIRMLDKNIELRWESKKGRKWNRDGEKGKGKAKEEERETNSKRHGEKRSRKDAKYKAGKIMVALRGEQNRIFV